MRHLTVLVSVWLVAQPVAYASDPCGEIPAAAFDPLTECPPARFARWRHAPHDIRLAPPHELPMSSLRFLGILVGVAGATVVVMAPGCGGALGGPIGMLDDAGVFHLPDGGILFGPGTGEAN